VMTEIWINLGFLFLLEFSWSRFLRRKEVQGASSEEREQEQDKVQSVEEKSNDGGLRIPFVSTKSFLYPRP